MHPVSCILDPALKLYTVALVIYLQFAFNLPTGFITVNTRVYVYTYTYYISSHAPAPVYGLIVTANIRLRRQ